MKRSLMAVLLAVSVALLSAPVALAQVEVSVQDRSFAWTGKEGPDANYRWTASVNNPSRRDLNVRVTIELLDAAGEVVAYDSADLMLPRMDAASVDQSSSLAVSTAETATQYRVVLVAID